MGQGYDGAAGQRRAWEVLLQGGGQSSREVWGFARCVNSLEAFKFITQQQVSVDS